MTRIQKTNFSKIRPEHPLNLEEKTFKMIKYTINKNLEEYFQAKNRIEKLKEMGTPSDAEIEFLEKMKSRHASVVYMWEWQIFQNSKTEEERESNFRKIFPDYDRCEILNLISYFGLEDIINREEKTLKAKRDDPEIKRRCQDFWKRYEKLIKGAN